MSAERNQPAKRTAFTMLKKAQGAPDGRTIKVYQEGETYEETGDLPAIFIRDGFAKAVGKAFEADNNNPARETKAHGEAPEKKEEAKKEKKAGK